MQTIHDSRLACSINARTPGCSVTTTFQSHALSRGDPPFLAHFPRGHGICMLYPIEAIGAELVCIEEDTTISRVPRVLDRNQVSKPLEFAAEKGLSIPPGFTLGGRHAMVKITGYDSNSSVIFRIQAVQRLHFAVGVGEAIEQNPIVYEITLYDRAVASRDGILVMALAGSRFNWESATLNTKGYIRTTQR